MNLKEQFATYEIALKLNELGFNEECLGKWSTNGNLHTLHYGTSGFRNNCNGLTYISAPLWQQVIDWVSGFNRGSLHIIIDEISHRACEPKYLFTIKVYGLVVFTNKISYFDKNKVREKAILKAIRIIETKKY